VRFFWHYLGNRLLTLLSNMINDLNLTDIDTGQKSSQRERLLGINLSANRSTF